ncbi:28S ribosomal protein S36, mitochondrial-like [Portunus trituberculatus]|uniref:28S ribosomal protein S36, mitochondrial n=1 Tax=Portunus trituberculatus TaxID=210409 RepID=A0A5B7EDJ1_PORTR|nr:28S ribosomal protein S36, mitochondrial-like [Portunus trituberculatus]MPC31435.1 28S ribosomal protein S36, mitochondrial [Portunus trituberculatus]
MMEVASVPKLVWRVVKPHIPLIRFRKGSPLELVHGSQEQSAVAGKTAVGGVTQAPKVLEEWEVPYKYRRPLITEEEIEYINRGGPA